MKAKLEEAINAILTEKDVNINHIQDVTDIFAKAAEAAADAWLETPEAMHDSLSDLSPKATANILVALIWGLYDFETGALNKRGKLLALQIAKHLRPAEVTALQNFIQEVGG